MLRISWKFLPAAAAWLLASASSAEVLYVSPNGQTNAPGTADKPLTLKAAFARAGGNPRVREIVLAGGVYTDATRLGSPEDRKKKQMPTLRVRAADGQTPILQGAIRVTQADPVPGATGVYALRKVPSGRVRMWERDTRIRYANVCHLAAVKAMPASCFCDRDAKVSYFHTSDDRPPQEHDVGFAVYTLKESAINVARPNVIIEGITFRDYMSAFYGQCILLLRDHVTIRGCHFDNARVAVRPYTWSDDVVIEDCTLTDIASGINSRAPNLIVRRCTIVKTRDRFLLPVYPQEDTGVEVYHPGRSAVVEDCVIRGYHNGVLIKAKPGRYVVRHNTIVDCHKGIVWTSASNKDAVVSHNLIANANDFFQIAAYPPGFMFDRNLTWNPLTAETLLRRIADTRGNNRGKLNVMADPRFVDPAAGDYRLLPDSPALFLKDAAGRPAGALPVAPQSAAAKVRPMLKLVFGKDSQPAGRTGVLTFDRDPWMGGGTSRIRDLYDAGSVPRRLVPQATFSARLRAFDAIGKIVKTRITIRGQAPQVAPYAHKQKVTLPDRGGQYRVRFEVQNERGVWSRPSECDVRLSRVPPKLKAPPHVTASRHGLIVTFQTDTPCVAKVRFGATADLGQTVECRKTVRRNWTSGDGGEWVETWTAPRTDFAVAILGPKVKPDQTVHMRVDVTDQAGLTTKGEAFSAAVRGPARTLYVATDGRDEPGRGLGQGVPCRTLQYAVDRALPGDRVVLLPGVYTRNATLYHGGLSDDVRITIEPDKPGTVTLDSAKREVSLIALEHAPYVTVRGLRIFYFQKAGIYAHKSPHLTVDRCVLFNDTGWTEGYGVLLLYSPHATVTRCLVVGGEMGLFFLASPAVTVKHNTLSQFMYCATCFHRSLTNTVQTDNSMCFSGNSIMSGNWKLPGNLKTFRSDYNNFGTIVRQDYLTRAKGTPRGNMALAEQFKHHYPSKRFSTRSKGVVRMGPFKTLSLKEWQTQSGQDKHSIFADPLYVRPYGSPDRWDWRIGPGSPNAGAGENGATIGAFEVAR